MEPLTITRGNICITFKLIFLYQYKSTRESESNKVRSLREQYITIYQSQLKGKHITSETFSPETPFAPSKWTVMVYWL